ncbi:MAG: tetratricopeptide repeat protein [Candidatus Puniceispirillaceae bacterium]
MITHRRPWFTSGLMAILLFAALHVGALSPATAADFDKGMTAYRSGDYQAALAEWRPLAESGHATAQFNLGLMYELGTGAPQDYAGAVAWYRRAAEQGDAKAQSSLGVLYELGRGVARDLVRTYVWYDLAAFNGSEKSQARRNLLETVLSAEQITQAKARARRCRDSNYRECGD